MKYIAAEGIRDVKYYMMMMIKGLRVFSGG